MASCVLQDPGLQESAPGGRKIRQPADRNQTGGHRAAAEHFPDAGSVSVVCLILYLSKNSCQARNLLTTSCLGKVWLRNLSIKVQFEGWNKVVLTRSSNKVFCPCTTSLLRLD